MFGNKSGVVRFGDATPVVDFFHGIGNTLKGAWDDWTGNTANRENIAYQQEYNDKVFNRADTEYERAVVGLRRAGLSPQLAAGNPATVAGASQAPQRTVGNESDAIAKLVDLVNSIKQTNSNVALASAQADQAKSETALNEIKARYESKQIDVFDESHEVDIASKRAQAAYHSALTQIAQLEGQSYASRVQSKLENEAADTAYKRKLIEVAQSEIDLAYSNIEYNQVKSSEASAHKDYLRQSIENLKQEKSNLVQEFANKVKSGLKIDAETNLLITQAVSAQIQNDIAMYNYNYSMQSNLRTTDSLPTVFGSGANWVGSSISKAVKNGFEKWSAKFQSDLDAWKESRALKKANKRDPYTLSEIWQLISDWNNKWTPINWLTK